MVQNFRYQLISLIVCTAVIHSHEYPCLTWEFHQDKLKFICRISRFTLPVSLFDSQGQWFATCTFTKTTYNCKSVESNDLIVVDFSRKTIAFATEKVDDNMNGVWVCSYENLHLTTNVSLSKGIIDSTEIVLNGTMLDTSSGNPNHILKCFSCREPDGNNAEFLVNGRTEDSITYSYKSQTCIHYQGECYPKECSCAANEFTRAFPIRLKGDIAVYSCDMLFTDPFTHAKFSVLASVVFNGKDFNAKNTSTSIIKAADKIRNKRSTAVGIKETTTESDESQSKFVPDILDNTSTHSTDEIQLILVVISTVISVVVGIMFIIYLIYKHRKAKVTRTCTKNQNEQKDENTDLLASTSSSSVVSSDNAIEDRISLRLERIDIS